MAYETDGFLTILAIDDDPAMRELFTGFLVDAGHLVIACESAEAGLEQLPFHTFDVSLVDHNLPGMEGLVLGEYLRQNNPRMTIALVTGSDDPRLAKLTSEHDIRLIAKPFDPESVLELIDTYKQSEDARIAAQKASTEDVYQPQLAAHWDAITDYLRLPSPPRRLEEALTQRIQRALGDLRLAGVASEELRVAAYAGLLAAHALGIKLPNAKDGRTLYQVYDELMVGSGRAVAFAAADRAPASR